MLARCCLFRLLLADNNACTGPCCASAVSFFFSRVCLFFAHTDQARSIGQNRACEPDKTTRGFASPPVGATSLFVAIVKSAQQKVLRYAFAKESPSTQVDMGRGGGRRGFAQAAAQGQALALAYLGRESSEGTK